MTLKGNFFVNMNDRQKTFYLNIIKILLDKFFWFSPGVHSFLLQNQLFREFQIVILCNLYNLCAFWVHTKIKLDIFLSLLSLAPSLPDTRKPLA